MPTVRRLPHALPASLPPPPPNIDAFAPMDDAFGLPPPPPPPPPPSAAGWWTIEMAMRTASGGAFTFAPSVSAWRVSASSVAWQGGSRDA
tara:strand:- start:453 stop:722 length:270 start_codon:yes stop_codon:yes gene_type:complete